MNFETSNIALYRLLNVLPIPLLHEMKFLELIYKFHYCNHLLPEVFQDYYIVNSSIHNHFTRNKSNLHITTVNSNYGKRSSLFRAGQFWNDLPCSFKLSSSYSVFKKNVKQYLLHRTITE